MTVDAGTGRSLSTADRHDGATQLAEPETAVPDGETPAARCPYCDRPFRTERLRALHVGEVHADVCTDTERGAYDEAYEAESDELFVFHLKVMAALVLLTFGLVYAYAFVWT